MTALLTRNPNNPILTADDVPYPCSLLFNAGVCRYQGQYVMVFRNDYGATEQTWDSGKRFDGTNLGIAYSDDGVKWQVQPQPLISLERAYELAAPLLPGRDASKEIQRFYDPRLTVIDGRIYMTFAVDTAHGLRGGILVTDDFESFEVLSLSVPDNRNMVLFPEKIGGLYVRLERPMPMYSRGRKDRFDTWLSRSPDLRFWGREELVMGVEDVPFANDKTGPAAPPIRTERGWLTTFHAVERDDTRGKHGWEPKWQKIYHAGLMLLDLENPAKVLGLVREPLLRPQTPYESETGFRTDVIFPGGMLLEDDGEVKIYYGAADTVECLATGHVDDLVQACLDAPLPRA